MFGTSVSIIYLIKYSMYYIVIQSCMRVKTSNSTGYYIRLFTIIPCYVDKTLAVEQCEANF